MNIPIFPSVFMIGTGELRPDGQIATGPERHIANGLSTRAYFAAHAPVEPAYWFQPTMPTERPTLRDFEASDVADADTRILCGAPVVNAVNNRLSEMRMRYRGQAAALSLNALASLEEASWWPGRRLSDAVRGWLEECARTDAAIEAWDREQAQERTAQWPWAWADIVIAAAGRVR